MIRLEAINKTFQTDAGAVHAVQNASLSINDGEIFGIIGFSGAGKSTLVRCINLLERPTSGHVLIDGTDITALKEKDLLAVRRRIGMIFQHFNLMPSRTVAGNIALALRHSPLSPAEKLAKIRELLRIVDLSDKENAYPSQLSGGQKQRVAIARALANDPSVLLCDEATSALDPQTTISILKLLKELNERLKLTIVVITHQMNIVKEICDRVAVMEKGCIVEEGAVYDIFAHPKSALTQSFINTTNNISAFLDLAKAGKIPGGDGARVCLLTFTGEQSNAPVMSSLFEHFAVRANIVYGSIDYLKGKPLGRLGVVLTGERQKVQDAVAYMKETGIEVEEVAA